VGLYAHFTIAVIWCKALETCILPVACLKKQAAARPFGGGLRRRLNWGTMYPPPVKAATGGLVRRTGKIMDKDNYIKIITFFAGQQKGYESRA
jgi:hypothetical protein